MKKAGVVAIVLIFLFVGCIGSKNKANTVTMDMNEVMHDMEMKIDNSSHYYYNGFKSLNPGDILIIKDEIENLSYSPQYNATMIIFYSNNSRGLFFEGDLENKFHIGDSVKIKLHIIEDKFEYPYQGVMWTIDFERYKEGWNSESHMPKLLPENVIYS